MEKVNELENRVLALEERNRRVETDKKWEGSVTRKALLMAFTYVAVLIYFKTTGVSSPYLSAVVPTLGFFLSTLTLPLFKKVWLKYQKH